MAVSEGYQDFVVEQLGRVCAVTARRMFGGVGLYANGVFFALIDDDRLYFKVDESNRQEFTDRGMGPFRPFGYDGYSMAYYEVPGDVLDDVAVLDVWIQRAVAVARKKRTKRR